MRRRIQILAIILASFIVQQTVEAKSSWKFNKAELNYVDLSNAANITAQPVKSEKINLKKTNSSDSNHCH